MGEHADYLLAVAAIVGVGALLVVSAGAIGSAQTDAANSNGVQETTTEQVAVLSVQNLTAPETVRTGENYTVAAEVVNQGDTATAQRVRYQISGNIIDSEFVHVAPETTETVSFDIAGGSTDGFPTGTFTHGVYTAESEATGDLTLTASDETTTVEETTVAVATAETTATTAETTIEGPTTTEAPVASVSFENQTTDGTTVTVDSVTVPASGYVVVHGAEITEGVVVESIVGTSSYLDAGTHRNVTVRLDEPLNESRQLVAVVYRDSNDNQEFDFVASGRTADGPYTSRGGEAVSDFARIAVETGETE